MFSNKATLNKHNNLDFKNKKLEIEISKEPLDENEVIERYILLFLGVVDRPIPSILHLEKEIFIFSNFNPKVKNFIHFEKHYNGPYSQEIKELVEYPIHFDSAWEIENGKIKITEKGKKLFKKLVQKFIDDMRFLRMLEVIKIIRDLYDKLTREELLLLVYVTFPKYKRKSKIFNEIYKKRKEIAKSLLKKNIITEERYKEILNW